MKKTKKNEVKEQNGNLVSEMCTVKCKTKTMLTVIFDREGVVYH